MLETWKDFFQSKNVNLQLNVFNWTTESQENCNDHFVIHYTDYIFLYIIL